MTRWIERYHEKLQDRQKNPDDTSKMRWDEDDLDFIWTGQESLPDALEGDEEDPTYQ